MSRVKLALSRSIALTIIFKTSISCHHLQIQIKLIAIKAIMKTLQTKLKFPIFKMFKILSLIKIHLLELLNEIPKIVIKSKINRF